MKKDLTTINQELDHGIKLLDSFTEILVNLQASYVVHQARLNAINELKERLKRLHQLELELTNDKK